MQRFNDDSQWRKYVVKYGGHGQSGQTIKLFRRLEKFVLPSILKHVFRLWWCETCVFSYTQQQFKTHPLGEPLKEMWHFRGRNIHWPPYIYEGSKLRTPGIYTPDNLSTIQPPFVSHSLRPFIDVHYDRVALLLLLLLLLLLNLRCYFFQESLSNCR